MLLLERLRDEGTWADFYEYKTSLCCPKQAETELRAYIDRRAYLPVCQRIEAGEPFPLPRRAVISKLSSQKKRVVYTYPPAENGVLKLLTHLLLRRYDGVFAPNLYSFRPGRSAKDAVRRLLRTPGLAGMYSYKADVHNYFNAIPVDRLLPMLAEVLAEDPPLLAFLSRLLTEPEVLDRGKPVREQKGIMAGTPLASFYANLYLRDLDRRFAALGVPYVRYSDDIILFAPTRAEAEDHAAFLRAFLAERGLSLNPDKEAFAAPEEGWTFLGFRCQDGTVDIAEATVKKLLQKMRRKARALRRWADRGGHTGEQAARAFIRVFNRKLLENPLDNELTWSYWFFSVISTDESLRRIDAYAQDCLRWLISGKRTKGRYNVRYETLKALGYRSLVHAYYAFPTNESTQTAGSMGTDRES